MRAHARKVTSGAMPVILGLALLGGLTLLSSASGQEISSRGVQMLIYVVVVIGLYTFNGNSGVLSFGHMAFMSIGAYATALLTIPTVLKSALLPNLPHWLASAQFGIVLAALAAAVLAGAIALVASLPLMRLPALAISLGMFAVLVIVYQVESNWTSVTRGRDAIVGVPTNTTLQVAFGAAVVILILGFVYQQSRFGLRLRAAREDELAAAALGVNVARERRRAFVLSAAFTAVGGTLYAEYLGAFNPDTFYLDITFLTLAMLIIGGVSTISGALVGPILVSVLNYVLSHIEQGITVGPLHIPARPGLTQVGLALVLLLILILRPNGVMGGRELRLPRFRREPASADPAQAVLSSRSERASDAPLDLAESGSVVKTR